MTFGQKVLENVKIVIGCFEVDFGHHLVLIHPPGANPRLNVNHYSDATDFGVELSFPHVTEPFLRYLYYSGVFLLVFEAVATLMAQKLDMSAC